MATINQEVFVTGTRVVRATIDKATSDYYDTTGTRVWYSAQPDAEAAASFAIDQTRDGFVGTIGSVTALKAAGEINGTYPVGASVLHLCIAQGVQVPDISSVGNVAEFIWKKNVAWGGATVGKALQEFVACGMFTQPTLGRIVDMKSGAGVCAAVLQKEADAGFAFSPEIRLVEGMRAVPLPEKLAKQQMYVAGWRTEKGRGFLEFFTGDPACRARLEHSGFILDAV